MVFRIRPAWYWIGLGSILVVGLFAHGGLRGYVSRRREYARLRSDLDTAQARLSDKQLLLARSQKDDAFLEMEARRHLGLVRPDEVEYRFVQDPDENAERMERREPSESSR